MISWIHGFRAVDAEPHHKKGKLRVRLEFSSTWRADAPNLCNCSRSMGDLPVTSRTLSLHFPFPVSLLISPHWPTSKFLSVPRSSPQQPFPLCLFLLLWSHCTSNLKVLEANKSQLYTLFSPKPQNKLLFNISTQISNQHLKGEHAPKHTWFLLQTCLPVSLHLSKCQLFSMVIPKPSNHPDSSLSHTPYPNWQQLPAGNKCQLCFEHISRIILITSLLQLQYKSTCLTQTVLASSWKNSLIWSAHRCSPLTTLTHHTTSLLNLRVKSQVPSCLRQDPVWAGPSPLSSWLTPPQPCSPQYTSKLSPWRACTCCFLCLENPQVSAPNFTQIS